jgi:cytochrome c oxidase assembly protein Cox11
MNSVRWRWPGVKGAILGVGATLVVILASAQWAGAAEAEAIRVRIGANVKGELAWDFWTTTPEVSLRPGEAATATYRVRNRGGRASFGKAFHATTPPEAQPFVEIIGCFCDQAIRLEPGEERDLTLVFRVQWEIPERLHDVLVEYDFWPATPEDIEKVRGASRPERHAPEAVPSR